MTELLLAPNFGHAYLPRKSMSFLSFWFLQGECIQPQASEDRAGTARATLPLQTDTHGASRIAGGKLKSNFLPPVRPGR
jgi:hypothetical protein